MPASPKLLALEAEIARLDSAIEQIETQNATQVGEGTYFLSRPQLVMLRAERHAAIGERDRLLMQLNGRSPIFGRRFRL